VTPRNLLRGLLLAFVAASLGYTAFRGLSGEGQAVAASPGSAGPTGQGGEAAGEPGNAPARKVVAWYFHGTKRCNTCRAIEAQAREAVEEGFPEALLQGLLEWRVTNVDEPGNGRFVTDYGLTGSSLVLVEFRDGRQARFRPLDRVWNLVADRASFQAYVQQEVRSWLEGPR